jgi:hypothetical protein
MAADAGLTRKFLAVDEHFEQVSSRKVRLRVVPSHYVRNFGLEASATTPRSAARFRHLRK